MEYVHIRLSAKLVLRELAGHRSDKQSPERIGGVVSAVVSIRGCSPGCPSTKEPLN